MKNDLKPIRDRVLIKPDSDEEQSGGGIFIPEKAKKKNLMGVVIAVGDSDRDEYGRKIKIEVKVGDRVVFGEYSGSEVYLDGEKHYNMHYQDVLAIIE